jgi:hypothetical protein
MRKHRRFKPLPKTYHQNTFTGELGVTLVSKLILQMGYAWNSTRMEAGIDGLIEIADPQTGEATNCIIMAQIKAVTGAFQSEKESGFSYTCERRDIQYWLRGNAPVVLIVCRPAKEEAYWIDVKRYFSLPENRETATVVFEKQTNRLDANSATALMKLAIPKGCGVYFSPEPKEETLISNLFPILHFGPNLFVAETKFTERDDFVEALKTKHQPGVREWVLWDRRIYSLHNLRDEPFVGLCDAGMIEKQALADLGASDEPDEKRLFARLLNACLKQLCWTRGLEFDNEQECFFFRPPIDLSTRQITCKSLERDGTRTVFERYQRKDDPSQTFCYRHQAFFNNLHRFDGKWFIEINPTYYFSADGRKSHPYSDQMLSGIKRLERHRSVVGHLLMWSEILASGPSLFSTYYEFLRLGQPERFRVDQGITDEHWQVGNSEDSAEPEICAPDEDESDKAQGLLW